MDIMQDEVTKLEKLMLSTDINKDRVFSFLSRIFAVNSFRGVDVDILVGFLIDFRTDERVIRIISEAWLFTLDIKDIVVPLVEWNNILNLEDNKIKLSSIVLNLNSVTPEIINVYIEKKMAYIGIKNEKTIKKQISELLKKKKQQQKSKKPKLLSEEQIERNANINKIRLERKAERKRKQAEEKEIKERVEKERLDSYAIVDTWLSIVDYNSIDGVVLFLNMVCPNIGFVESRKPTIKQLVVILSNKFNFSDSDSLLIKNHLNLLKEKHKEACAVAKLLRSEEIKKENVAKAKLYEEKLDDIDVMTLKSALNITDTEYKRWKETSKLPIKRQVSFNKWGKTLITNIYSAKVIKLITPMVVNSWREEDVRLKRARFIKVKEIGAVEKISGYENWGFDLKSTSYYQSEVVVDIRISWFGKLLEWKFNANKSRVIASNDLWVNHWSLIEKLFADYTNEQVIFIEDYYHKMLRPETTEDARLYLNGLLLSIVKRSFPTQWLELVKVEIKRYYLQVDKNLARIEILSNLTLHEFPNLFFEARKKVRKFIMHIGPTNSGKTYEAYEALARAKSGVFLAPLRLLALEGRDTLESKGVAISLITGEEQQLVENNTHVSSTIEMANFNVPLEVAVIDEFQMIYDADRGWAWTNAICGIPADVIYLCGSPESVPAVSKLIESLGDTLEIKYFERKTPLEYGANFTVFEKGDAIIAFSKKNVIAIRECLKDMGLKVSTIYGALSPEVRKSEANRFISGETDVVVSTDAIGMGLNLPIKRVIFSEIAKYDGESFRELTHPEVMQIAGRAGRYGHFEKGEVIGLDWNTESMIRDCLKYGTPEGNFEQISISPTLSHINYVSETLKTNKLSEILNFFVTQVIVAGDLFKLSKLKNQLLLSEIIDVIAPKMSVEDKVNYSHLPINKDDAEWFNFLLVSHMKEGVVLLPSLSKFTDSDSYLDKLTTEARLLTSYIWLSFKYPLVYTDYLLAMNKRLINSKSTEKHLVDSSHHKASKKNLELKRHILYKLCPDCDGKMDFNWPHRICDDCYREVREFRNYNDRYW